VDDETDAVGLETYIGEDGVSLLMLLGDDSVYVICATAMVQQTIQDL